MPGEDRVTTFLLSVTYYSIAQGWQMMRGQEKIPPNLGAAGSNRIMEAFHLDQSGAPEKWVW